MRQSLIAAAGFVAGLTCWRIATRPAGSEQGWRRHRGSFAMAWLSSWIS